MNDSKKLKKLNKKDLISSLLQKKFSNKAEGGLVPSGCAFDACSIDPCCDGGSACSLDICRAPF